VIDWHSAGFDHLDEYPSELVHPEPEKIHYGNDEFEAFIILAGKLLGEYEIRYVETPVGTIEIRKQYLPHMVEKRKDARERYAHYVLPTLVWELVDEWGAVKRRYIALFDGKYDFMVVIVRWPDGSVFWNMMHAKRRNMNSHRKGECIYKR